MKGQASCGGLKIEPNHTLLQCQTNTTVAELIPFIQDELRYQCDCPDAT